nr:hypothetical protein Itr_chr07CG06480 [Ipomoea trifida]
MLSFSLADSHCTAVSPTATSPLQCCLPMSSTAEGLETKVLIKLTLAGAGLIGHCVMNSGPSAHAVLICRVSPLFTSKVVGPGNCPFTVIVLWKCICIENQKADEQERVERFSNVVAECFHVALRGLSGERQEPLMYNVVRNQIQTEFPVVGLD